MLRALSKPGIEGMCLKLMKNILRVTRAHVYLLSLGVRAETRVPPVTRVVSDCTVGLGQRCEEQNIKDTGLEKGQLPLLPFAHATTERQSSGRRWEVLGLVSEPSKVALVKINMQN